MYSVLVMTWVITTHFSLNFEVLWGILALLCVLKFVDFVWILSVDTVTIITAEKGRFFCGK